MTSLVRPWSNQKVNNQSLFWFFINSDFENHAKYILHMYLNVLVNYLNNIKCKFVMNLDYHDNLI